MTQYTRNDPAYFAAEWDGIDPRPVDDLLNGLFGSDYLGLTVDEVHQRLTVHGAPDSACRFGVSGYELVIDRRMFLVMGPVYGSDRSDAVWPTLTPSALFLSKFTAVPA